MAVAIDDAALAQLVQVLKLADSPSTEAQRQVVEQLDYFSKNIPELPAYLVNIFALSRDQSELIRVRAGLTLKNSIQQRLAAFPTNVREYVKETIWSALEDETSAQVRNTASSVIDWLIRCIGPLQWPEATARLLHYMNSPSEHVKVTAYKTVANICRQTPRVMGDVEVNGQKPLETIVPMMIQEGLSSPSVEIRKNSLNALNSFIVPQSAVLANNMQPYLAAVFNLTSDNSIPVRKGVVEALNTMLTFWPEQVIPHIEPVIDFMLFCLTLKDEQEEVALVAAEFLLTFTEEPDLYDQLQLHIERFLPGLLQALAFSPNSREVLDLEDDDASVPDKATDVKPHIYKNRTTGGSSAKTPSLAARLGMTSDDVQQLGQSNAQNSDDDDEDEAEDDEDEDEDDAEADWTVRIAASQALGYAAEGFEGAILEILLPQVNQMLNSGDWAQREAAVHALGSVAMGCGASMHEHLPSLIPFLLQSLSDPHPLIRAAAAWTIGEYSIWVADEGNSYLVQVIQGLLNVSLDNNKHAQASAIIAFGHLAKEAGPTGALTPYLQSIAQAFVAAFGRYQSRNILKLYEAITYLSDGVGPGGLNDEQVLNALMPPLIQRWQTFADDDINLLHLLGCLTSLVVAAGPGFKNYADPVFDRAYRIMQSVLYQYQLYQSDRNNNPLPEHSWLVVALDLVSSLVQALGEDSKAKLAHMTQSIDGSSLPLLLMCTSYSEADVQQSTFALIGDVATHAVEALYPILGQLVPLLVERVNPRPKLSQVSAESNCVWCLGELSMSLGANMEPFVETLLQRLLPILSSVKASPNLLENTAVTMGRLALAAPRKVAPHLGEIIRIWSQTMAHVSSGPEQDAALRGMCEAAKYNPAAITEGGTFLLQALAKSENPSNELRTLSAPIIQALQA